MRFSAARPQDEAAIKQFLEANDLPYQDIKPADLEHFFMAWDSSAIIGLIGLQIQGNCALLRSLAVNKDHRNRGLGTMLVDKIEGYARSLKIRNLYLLTMTAEGFFTKSGFKATAREAAPDDIQKTTEFRELCPASAAFMAKRL